MNSTKRWADRNLMRVGRRWFLSAAGIAVALPYLESMVPQNAYAAGAATKRLFLFHMPAGVNVSTWMPSGTGANFTFGPAMKPVATAGLQAKATVVTGTSAIGGPRGHTCGISGVLTGVQCQGNSSTNAVSFDQLAAQTLGAQTPFPSIELGTAHNTENPNAESGYSTVLKDNLNWVNGNTPLSREIIPLNAFNRLFSLTPMAPSGDAGAAQMLNVKDAMRKSVLDYALAEGNALTARLGTADRVKLDQYLSGLRDLEKTIQTTPTVGQTGVCTPGTAPAAGKPSDIQAHVKLMLDIIVMAFQCGSTRVATFAYEHTTTEIQHPFLGVNVGYHQSVTHHNNQPAALANYTTVNQWLVSQFVYAAQKLDAIKDGAGTMLDSSACMCFSELSDGNSHSNQNMPMLLLGSAGGKLQTGKVVGGSGPNEQVHLAILQALGVTAQTFGRAKGPLAGVLV
ncbi:MAG: DUF1552 domain-containing protein [Myxococcota bacterium]|nr:DUF1552 domain-containing protein [Myxococcota bacterium]